MHIQINSDNNITADSELAGKVRAEVQNALERFESDVTRVEVFLTDVNGSKSGERDKRCVMEARPANHEALAVSDQAAELDGAVSGATRKMVRVLTDHFEKLRDKHRDRT